MEKRIIEISKDNTCLSLYKGFLVIKNEKEGWKQNISLDSILSILISANQVSITNKIINKICDYGGSLIFCNGNYLPNVISLSYSGHWLISSRIKQQISLSLPLQKNLWKSIVKNKILNQAKILKLYYPNNTNIERLKVLSKGTLSDDKTNNEGQAASIYFKSLFGPNFIRNRNEAGINTLLNYAYTVLRAIVARAVTGNGLLPYIGLKHCNKTNTFPLIDDLIEPFRIIADKIVFDIISSKNKDIELTPEIKREITSIIVYPVHTTKGNTSLNEAIYNFVSTLVKSYENKKDMLEFPELL